MLFIWSHRWWTWVGLMFLVVLSSSIHRCQSVKPISFSSPASCSDNQFYQSGNLSCVSCRSNAIRASDGVSCECEDGYYEDIQTPQCVLCGNNSQVTSVDGLYCLECEFPLTLSNGICSSCNFTSIYVDILPPDQSTNGIRSCVTCPSGTWAGPSKTTCVPCGIPDCTSCTSSFVSGGVCFSSSLSTPSASNSFPYYIEHFSSARQLCQNGNQTACQLLLNLCVLMKYSRSAPACEEAIELSNNQPSLVPSIYYPTFGANEYIVSTGLNNKFSTVESDSSSSLIITAAKYSLNGTFLGLTNVTDTNEIILCQDRPSRLASAWRVGVQYGIQCSIDSADLASDEPIFYDLFLYDPATRSSEARLVPLPILVSNYRDDNGNFVNNGDRNRWQLTRRLFLSQSVTNSPSYASYMHLNIRLQTRGAIDIPHIYVTYSDLPSDGSAKASFSVILRHPGEDLNTALAIIVSVFVIIVVVYAGVVENGFLKRQGSALCELQTIVFVVVRFCSAVSSSIVFILSVSALLMLVIFKGQTELLLALPVGKQEACFISLLVIAFVFRLISVAYLIWKQVTIDIFLIDWEKPKVHVQQRPGEVPIDDAHHEAPVSVWRTYFVANEWNEIQCLRRIRPVPVLLAVLLFLEVIGLVNLCEADPSSYITRTSDRYSAPQNLILRFGISVTFYFLFALCLRAYIVLIHERFVENKIKQFVDFCSVSNVSVFILSHDLYGHYIHGRSVHGNADTNMKHMNENLIKEQENQCGRRGLIPDTDQQTFEVAVTPTFKAQYNKILTPLLAERVEGPPTTGNVTGIRGSPVTDVSLEAYKNMNVFLSSVIDHSFPECDHVVKKKLLIEKIMDLELHSPVERSIFYQGDDNSFADVLFYNNEWVLLTFDVLVFCVVDLAATNFTLAAIITYFCIKLLELIRFSLGKRNLGRKTLVDNRFLI